MPARIERPKRQSRYLHIAHIAYELAKKQLPTYSHPNSPHTYTLPPLTACVLLGFSLDLNYRDLEEWLPASESICQVVGRSSVPDHSTLSRVIKRLKIQDWQRLQQAILERVAPEGLHETLIAVGSTGYRESRASAYEQAHTGQTREALFPGRLCRGVCQSVHSGDPSGIGTQHRHPGFARFAP